MVNRQSFQGNFFILRLENLKKLNPEVSPEVKCQVFQSYKYESVF